MCLCIHAHNYIHSYNEMHSMKLVAGGSEEEHEGRYLLRRTHSH